MGKTAMLLASNSLDENQTGVDIGAYASTESLTNGCEQFFLES